MKYDKIIAGAIIYRYNEGIKEVLVIRRSKFSKWPYSWEFPRGSVDPKDATSRDAAKREAKEETGLDVEPKELIDRYEYKFTRDGITHRSLQKNYLCKPVDVKDRVVLRINEHDRYRWLRDVSEINLKKEIKDTLENIFNLKEADKIHTEKEIKTIIGENIVFDI